MVCLDLRVVWYLVIKENELNFLNVGGYHDG